jgi:hypothetical protein
MSSELIETLRFSDPETVAHYPLHIPGPIAWQGAEGGYSATVPLLDLPAASIIAPSFSLLGTPDYRFRFSLEWADGSAPLPQCPVEPESRPDRRDGTAVRTAIDCFHTVQPLRDVRLVLWVACPSEPQRYLLTASVRPCRLDVQAPEPLATRRAPEPPRFSQMLENPRIANRICSPVSTAMVLTLHRPDTDRGAVIAECHDPATRMYGLWPLAIRAASVRGIVGAVELFHDWSPVQRCLERGLPLVASIRYGADELPGAAQRASGGHLVVVHGIDGDAVLVNDPAAPDHGSVARRLPLDAFGRAWFRCRGAAYILAP